MYQFLFIIFGIIFSVICEPNYDPTEYGSFFHLTDPHLDLNYAEGSVANCHIPLCCRTESKTTDEPIKAKHFATMGYKCDIPHDTWISTLKYVQKLAQDKPPDFIFYGGDNIHHADWEQSQESQLQYLSMIAQDLGKYFPQTKVYYSLGNHDSFPVNVLNYTGEHTEQIFNLMDKEFGQRWKLSDTARSQIRKFGFYSESLDIPQNTQKLRLISLNSQFVNPLNFYVYQSEDDKSNQLGWLESQLELAQKNNERVIVVGHIPPGYSRSKVIPESLEFWNSGFEKLLVKYEKIVIGQFYGHTHEDDFGIFRDYSSNSTGSSNSHYGRPISVAFTSPAVVPYGGDHYPNVRRIIYSRKTGDLVDIVTYYNNITKSNNDGNMESNWGFEYSFREAYNLNSLSPQDIDTNVLGPLWKNDEKVWNTFGYYYHSAYKTLNCEGNCRKNRLCSMSHLTWTNYLQCVLA